MSILKTEIHKFFKKKDSLFILIALLIVPAVLSICFRFEVGGIAFSGQVTSVEYILMIWSFLKYVFILYIVPVYLPCNFLAKEIEQRSVQLLLVREERNRILISKIIAFILEITAFMALFMCVTALCYQFLIVGTKIEAIIDATIYDTMTTVMLFGLQWLEMMFMMMLAVMLGIVLKGNATLVASIGVLALEKVLEGASSLKGFIPSSISDFANCVTQIEQNNFLGLQSFIVYIVIIGVLLFLSFYAWNKREF